MTQRYSPTRTPPAKSRLTRSLPSQMVTAVHFRIAVFYFRSDMETFVCFCWIKAISVCLDHCRAKGSRTGCDSGPGRNGRRPSEIDLTIGCSLPVHEATLCIPLSSDGHTLPGAAQVRLVPGGRRPPGPDYIGRWGMGDDARTGQKDGSAHGASLARLVGRVGLVLTS